MLFPDASCRLELSSPDVMRLDAASLRRVESLEKNGGFALSIDSECFPQKGNVKPTLDFHPELREQIEMKESNKGDHVPLPLLITLDDAAKCLHLSRRTIEREISAGRFPRPLKIGRSSRVSMAALQAYIDRLAGALSA